MKFEIGKAYKDSIQTIIILGKYPDNTVEDFAHIAPDGRRDKDANVRLYPIISLHDKGIATSKAYEDWYGASPQEIPITEVPWLTPIQLAKLKKYSII